MILLLTLGWLAGCHRKAVEEPQPLPPVKVKIRHPRIEETPKTIRVSGTVHARREANLASRTMAQVRTIKVKGGDVVSQGQVLIELDDRAIKGQIAQAEGALAQAKAALQLAESNFRRFQELYERESASQLELDMARMNYKQAQGAVKAAEGALKAAKSQMDDIYIVAPFKGKILEVLTKEGNMAAPGYPLIRMEDQESLELWVEVNESDLPRIDMEKPVWVEVPSAGFSGNTTPTEVQHVADPMSHNITVKLALPYHPSLFSGHYGEGVFTLKGPAEKQFWVPREALLTKGQIHYVFTLEDDHAKMMLIKTGDERDGMVASLTPLEGVSLLVSNTPLQDGQPVEVIP